MIGAGIYDGDLLVVDRAEAVVPGRIVIARIYDEFTCKRVVRHDNAWWLKRKMPVTSHFQCQKIRRSLVSLPAIFIICWIKSDG